MSERKRMCRKCGFELENSFAYCPKCGAKYEEAPKSYTPQAAHTGIAQRTVGKPDFNYYFTEGNAPLYVPDTSDAEKYSRAAEIFFRNTPDEDAPIETKALALAAFAAMLNSVKNREKADFSLTSELSRTYDGGHGKIDVCSRRICVRCKLGEEEGTCYDGGCYSDEIYYHYEQMLLFCLDASEFTAYEWKTPKKSGRFTLTRSFNVGEGAEFSIGQAYGRIEYYYFKGSGCTDRTSDKVRSDEALLLNCPFGLKGCYGLACYMYAE